MFELLGVQIWDGWNWEYGVMMLGSMILRERLRRVEMERKAVSLVLGLGGGKRNFVTTRES